MSVIKIKYHDETRRASFDHAPVFSELQAAVTQFWPALASIPFKLTYVDPEGDKITLGSDAELAEASQFAKTAGTPLRLIVVEKATKGKESAASPAPSPFAGLPFNAESLQAFLAQLPGLAASTGNALPDLSSLFSSLGLNNNTTGSTSASSGAQQANPSETFAAFLPLLHQLLATPWIREFLAQAHQAAHNAPCSAPQACPAPAQPCAPPQAHPLFGGRHGCGRGGWRGRGGHWGGFPGSASPAGPFPCAFPGAAPGTNNDNNNNSNEPARHEGVVCDGCNTSPIIGERFKCTVCADYDLCSSCEAKKVHDQSHPLVKFTLPRQPFHGGAFHGPWFRGPGFHHHHARRFGGPFGGPWNAPQSGAEEDSADNASSRHPFAHKWAKKERKYLARFVQDTTIPDGVTVQAGTKFVKLWRLKNEASIPWPEGAVLSFVGGDQLGAPSSVPLPVAKEGEEIDVAVDMIAPDRAGRYTGFWRPMTQDGVKFGQRVWVDFFVAPIEASAPAPKPVQAVPVVPSAPAVAMEVTPPAPIPAPAPVVAPALYPAVPLAEPTVDELRALAVLQEMGFQGDLLFALRRNKGQLLPTIRELCA